MQTFPETETTFLLPGPAGELEVLTSVTSVITKRNAVAIICHPHPQHGGTMHNKVVSTLARVFHDLGLRTVRFNYRGVGKSTGSYGEGIGELADLFAVIEWVRQVCPDEEIWLAGFSFGAYISITAATQTPIARLISVAPPVPWYDPHATIIVDCPWVIVQGDDDEIISAEKVYHWVDTLHPKPQLIRFKHTGHFFHGKLVELRESLISFLEKAKSCE